MEVAPPAPKRKGWPGSRGLRESTVRGNTTENHIQEGLGNASDLKTNTMSRRPVDSPKVKTISPVRLIQPISFFISLASWTHFLSLLRVFDIDHHIVVFWQPLCLFRPKYLATRSNENQSRSQRHSREEFEVGLL